jgi:alkane 1-monooxygenase
MAGLRFALMPLLLLAATWRLTRGGPWMWAPLLVSAGLVSLADTIGPDETSDLSDAEPWLLNLWLFLTLPLLLAMHTALWWLAGTGDALGLGAALLRVGGPDLAAARQATGPWSWLGGVLSCGFLTAAAGTTVGHELVHRTRQPFHLIWGRWLLALTFDASFAIEHVYGHHAKVSTFEDPASARRHERVYTFILRSTLGQLRSAWRIERKRLSRKSLPPWSPHNRFLRGWLFSAVWMGLAYRLGGGRAVAFFITAGLWGKAILEIINFVEHYGLVRLPGTRVEPRHSWNSNAWMSSTILYHLTRHSDHHAEGSKPFWRLRPIPEAPTLPAGYMGMLVVALVPSWYQRLMRPRLADWDAQHANEAERQVALEENRRAGWLGAN